MVARCRARDGVSSHQWLPVAAQWLHRMTGVGILHNISGPQLCNAPTQSNILNIYCAGDGLNQLTVGAVHATGRKIISPGDWRTVAGSVTSVTRQSYQWEALASVWCTGQKYQLSRKVLGPTPRSLGAATCWSPFLKPFIFQCTLVLLSACSILYNFAKCIKYFYHWNSEGLTFS